MTGRIKKVTTTYYTLDGEVSHTETQYWTQVKYPIIGWVTGNFGWSTLTGAKRHLFEKLGTRFEKVEYIDL